VKDVLDELTRLGLLTRSEVPPDCTITSRMSAGRITTKRITSATTSKRPYVLSRLRAKGVAWASHPAKAPVAHGNVTTARAVHLGPPEDAPWATPFIKEHAVELNRTSSPAEAAARQRYDGRWGMAGTRLRVALVEHRSAWMAGAKTGP
jgi:hypothetical protein